MMPSPFVAITHIAYTPCRPGGDGIAIVSARWLEWSSPRKLTQRTRALVVHQGALRYEECQDLPLAVLQAMADAIAVAMGGTSV